MTARAQTRKPRVAAIVTTYYPRCFLLVAGEPQRELIVASGPYPAQYAYQAQPVNRQPVRCG